MLSLRLTEEGSVVVSECDVDVDEGDRDVWWRRDPNRVGERVTNCNCTGHACVSARRLLLPRG